MIEARETDTILIKGPWELPRGWEWISLGSICDIVIGGTPSRDNPDYWGNGHTWVTITDMNDRFVTNSKEQITDLGVAESNVKEIDEGTLLMSFKLTIGKTAIAGKKLYTNEAIAALPIKAHWREKIKRDFLFHALHVVPLAEAADLAVKGKTLNKAKLAHILLPVPFPNDHIRSFDVQNRLVSRIEAHLADLNEARETLDGMKRDIDEVMEAVLKEIFEDLYHEVSSWDEKLVSELCYTPQYGYTQSATFEPIGPRFLRITDIQDDRVDWSTVPYCQISQKQLPTYQLEKGDILFARTGATTGKTFLVQECPTAVFASYLIRLRIREKILPELLAWFFKSNVYWDQIRPRGGAQPNMNAKLLGKLRVRYPLSSQEQQQIVNYLDSTKSELNIMQNT